jgi:hypothetical protein
MPTLDLDGAARIVDGNFDGVARVDMGGYEFADAAPTAVAGRIRLSWPMRIARP